MKCLIIDYGSGNLHSAHKAFQQAAQSLNGSVAITQNPNALASASHIVLPGVGAFADCIAGLRAVDGMIEALEEAVLRQGIWFFGICVGMQMMLQTGLEHGEHRGLGWIKGRVVELETKPPLKKPHMGWNTLSFHVEHPLFQDISPESHAYFVHSYHAECDNQERVMATSDYSQAIAAVIGQDNYFGSQFHPEKSGATGLKMVENFLRLA